MSHYNYDGFFDFLKLSYNDLTLEKFRLKWNNVINEHNNKLIIKENRGEILSQAESVFQLITFPILEKKYLQIVDRNEFLHSMKNKVERDYIVNGFIYSSYKVAKCLLEIIKEHSPDEHNELIKQIELSLKNSLHYIGACLSSSSSRWHYYSLNEVRGYEGLRGDELKTAILMNFRQKLEDITDLKGQMGLNQISKEMSKYINEFKQSDQYMTLKTSQGIATSFFKMETDSELAVEKIIDTYAEYNPRQTVVEETSEIEKLLSIDSPGDLRITF
ncbi:MAG: hypothetical protein H0T84_10555 [Tatlockia sp.]|nr:hypothetical protein [Tatlockia sp.]